MAKLPTDIKKKIFILNLSIHIRLLQMKYRIIWQKMKKKCAILCYGKNATAVVTGK